MPARPAREAQSDPEAVGELRRWIEELSNEAGATAGQRANVALAVSEALTNVVMHAYVGRSAGPMRVRAEHVDHSLRVEVEDDGIGLGARHDSPGAGLGLALIASLATELELALGPGGAGTLVRMTFKIG